MKVLETTYRGFRFRSRLEARWAVFMDSMGVEFEYEREAYELDGMCYLPDFWLPEIESHVEIKPTDPNPEEVEKAYRLAQFTQKSVHFFVGAPRCPCVGEYMQEAAKGLSFLIDKDGGVRGQAYTIFGECPNCHRVEVLPLGDIRLMSCGCYQGAEKHMCNVISPRLVKAYHRAISFRFDPTSFGVSRRS